MADKEISLQLTCTWGREDEVVRSNRFFRVGIGHSGKAALAQALVCRISFECGVDISNSLRAVPYA
jgi:hypothetical protein